jgi:hypothetical protein
VPPSASELDDEPELGEEPELELALADALPLEELYPLPEEDALEDPPSGSPCCETSLPPVEHAKAVHAKVRAAAVSVALKPLDMLMNADCPGFRPMTVLSLIVAEPVGAGRIAGGPMTMPSSPGLSMSVFSRTIPVEPENRSPWQHPAAGRNPLGRLGERFRRLWRNPSRCRPATSPTTPCSRMPSAARAARMEG